MHHNYGVISGRRKSTDCVWPVTLVAVRLYNLLWRVSAIVVIWFNVTFLPLRIYWKKSVPVSWAIRKVQQCIVARFRAVRLFIRVFDLIINTTAKANDTTDILSFALAVVFIIRLFSTSAFRVPKYSTLFFEHYNCIRIILGDWVPGRYSVSLRTCAGHNTFILHQSLARVALYFLNMRFSCPPLDVVLYQVLPVSEQPC